MQYLGQKLDHGLAGHYQVAGLILRPLFIVNDRYVDNVDGKSTSVIFRCGERGMRSEIYDGKRRLIISLLS